jgi:laminin alpha 3/5
VLVVNYYQPGKEFRLPMNITYTPKDSEDPLDIAKALADGQYHAAVLPLPTCLSNSGCRAVIETNDDPEKIGTYFDINGEFNIQSVNPEGNPAWLESIIAVPLNNYEESFADPQKVDMGMDFARECGQNHFYVSPVDEGYCRKAVLSLSSNFNGGAVPCVCDNQGTMAGQTSQCAKMGGQCDCKPNVIGQECTRCKPGFFGFPDCKQCTCPPTARCDETTGDCICAPHVTGTPGNECSTCEENTFGYDPITGCQECACKVQGTMSGNMSCSLENGNCL